MIMDVLGRPLNINDIVLLGFSSDKSSVRIARILGFSSRPPGPNDVYIQHHIRIEVSELQPELSFRKQNLTYYSTNPMTTLYTELVRCHDPYLLTLVGA